MPATKRSKYLRPRNTVPALLIALITSYSILNEYGNNRCSIYNIGFASFNATKKLYKPKGILMLTYHFFFCTKLNALTELLQTMC